MSKQFYCRYRVGTSIFTMPILARNHYLSFKYCLKKELLWGYHKTAEVDIFTMDNQNNCTVYWHGTYSLIPTPTSYALKSTVDFKHSDFTLHSMWG